MLPEIVEAVKGRLTIGFDGGIRSGSDMYVITALFGSFAALQGSMTWLINSQIQSSSAWRRFRASRSSHVVGLGTSRGERRETRTQESARRTRDYSRSGGTRKLERCRPELSFSGGSLIVMYTISQGCKTRMKHHRVSLL